MKTTSILGYDIADTSYPETLAFLESHIRNKRPFGMVMTLNPEIVMRASENPTVKAIIDKALLRLPDGTGLVWAAKRLTGVDLNRVTGMDLVQKLLLSPYKVYFLGSKPEIVKASAEKVAQAGGCAVVGYHHGYFSDAELPKISQDIAAAKPDIVFVGLGFPRQETVLDYLQNHLSTGIGIGVGGVFDVLSGTKKRAPKAFQAVKLEWFFRGLIEPGRMKRWGFIPSFVGRVIRQKKFSPKPSC